MTNALYVAAEAERIALRSGVELLRIAHPELADEVDVIIARSMDAYVDTYCVTKCESEGHILTERVDSTLPRQCLRCNQYPTEDKP